MDAAGLNLVTISVSLISGQAANFTVDLSESACVLLDSAKKAFRCYITDIVSSRGCQLNQNLSLAKLGVVEGEALTAVVSEYLMFSTLHAFAAVSGDGSVVTWGNADLGGDSSTVQDQLRSKVHRIFSTYGAFAALLDDGSVVTWGCKCSGGDSRDVQEQLRGKVHHIYSTFGAFAALLDDGSVVTWGCKWNFVAATVEMCKSSCEARCVTSFPRMVPLPLCLMTAAL
eukprot:TRINITY_DN7957_c1_g1_i10.p1 TRINITY_DN7957_c1_g1~~TRINITY_DN7957_c1_g1_i10.p1  ORF type:complete len:243 (+),score=46.13 TRINITY_DN7957_c1_g1_i10:47-730(+)